jgi:hypothetical protein
MGNQNWETPPDFWNWINGIFHFDIDVAGSAENRKCRYRWITEEMDALDLDIRWSSAWMGECGTYEDYANSSSYGGGDCIQWAWCNPPYGNGIPDLFTKKARDVALRESVSTCILTHARTGSASFYDNRLSIAEIWMLTPRIQFLPPPGEKKTSNNRDSMLLIITPQSVAMNSEPVIKLVRWK